MIEGLWIVRFLQPNDPQMDLNGGVIVIETGRAFGGDSGYYYVGNIGDADATGWPIQLTISRHDPAIESVFGDMDEFELSGRLEKQEKNKLGQSMMIAKLHHTDTGLNLLVELKKAADLP